MAITIGTLAHRGLTQNICACETLFLLTNTYGGQVGENLLQKTLTNRNSDADVKKVCLDYLFCTMWYLFPHELFVYYYCWPHLMPTEVIYGGL